MRKRILLAAALAAVLAAGPVAAVDGAAAKSRPKASKKLRLKAFRTCTGLIAHGRRHASRAAQPSAGPPRGAPVLVEGGPVAPQTGGPATGAPAGDDFSGTNVQEAGIDEPDIVKTDGTRIFAVTGGALHAADARGGTPKLLGSLPLDGYGHELLISNGHALVVSHVFEPSPGDPQPQSIAPIPFGRSLTLLTEIDLRDPAAMRVIRTQKVEGHHVSSRLNGSSARVVIASYPDALVDERQRGRLEGWMPSSSFESRLTGRRKAGRLASCRAVRRPRIFAGLDMLTVLTIDLSKGLPAVDVDSVLTGGETVYASGRSLYVATQRWIPEPASPDQRPPKTATAVHRFDVSEPRETSYRASGEVPGYLLNQFSLSEHHGVLRAATTDSPQWWGGAPREESQSYVTTLGERSGGLVELGRVGGLGRGERIFAVRFIGDSGFVVTFRQVDPLYTLDLSDPRGPRVAGELKILGYSAYLHPVGDDLLLGVGQDATEAGRTLGTQISLFDVSDLRNPARLQQRRVGSSSEVEYDHHAFLYWAPSRLAVMPVQLFENRRNPFQGAIGFRIGRTSGIEEAGRVAHPGESYPPQVRRALVVGDRLFTVSEAGVKANGLATFADQAWIPFPVPPDGGPQPQPGGATP